MSSVPPPPPGAPGQYPGSYPPGPPGAPGGYPPGPPGAGPPGGGYGPPGGYQPPGAPPPPGGYPTGGYPPQGGGGGSKTGLIVGLAVGGVLLIIVVLVGVVVLTSGPSSIDEEEAATSLDTIIDEADFEETDAALRDCPLGEPDEIVAASGEALDTELDLPDDAQSAFDEFEDAEAGVVCTIVDDEDDPNEGIYAFSTPRPSGDYADSVDNTFGDDDDVTVEDPDGYRGGDVYAYCVEPGDDSTNEGCGADWVGEDIAVGLFFQGLDADVDTATDAIRDQVGDMVDALAEAEPDFES